MTSAILRVPVGGTFYPVTISVMDEGVALEDFSQPVFTEYSTVIADVVCKGVIVGCVGDPLADANQIGLGHYNTDVAHPSQTVFDEILEIVYTPQFDGPLTAWTLVNSPRAMQWAADWIRLAKFDMWQKARIAAGYVGGEA